MSGYIFKVKCIRGLSITHLWFDTTQRTSKTFSILSKVPIVVYNKVNFQLNTLNILIKFRWCEYIQRELVHAQKVSRKVYSVEFCEIGGYVSGKTYYNNWIEHILILIFFEEMFGFLK